jgi:hypothetical protein
VFTHCKPLCFVQFPCSRAKKTARDGDPAAEAAAAWANRSWGSGEAILGNEPESAMTGQWQQAASWHLKASRSNQPGSRIQHLMQSAKLKGLDPWAYLCDVLSWIHSHPSYHIEGLLSHRWRPTEAS